MPYVIYKLQNVTWKIIVHHQEIRDLLICSQAEAEHFLHLFTYLVVLLTRVQVWFKEYSGQFGRVIISLHLHFLPYILVSSCMGVMKNGTMVKW